MVDQPVGTPPNPITTEVYEILKMKASVIFKLYTCISFQIARLPKYIFS